jgi:TRAP-type mannitol/chloroaromatic compound transport system permease small subunit
MARMLGGFVRTVNALNDRVGKAVALVFLIMLLLVTGEVVLRYGFRAPTTWGTEAIGFLFSGYILLGGGYTLLHRDHVNVDIFYKRLNERTRAAVDVFTAGFVLLYCGVLLWQSAVLAWEAIETGRRTGTDWNPPLFPVMASMPIGAALLMLQAMAKFVRDVHFALTGRELANEH